MISPMVDPVPDASTDADTPRGEFMKMNSPMRSASDAAAFDDDYDDKASALSSNLTNQERVLLQVMNRMKRISLPKLYPELSPAEADLLEVVLQGSGNVTVSAIAASMDLPLPAISRLLRTMETRQLIVRTILPQDRRSIVVNATPEGKRRFHEMRQCVHSFLQESLTSISAEEFSQMIREWNHVLDRMEAAMETHRHRRTQKDPAPHATNSLRQIQEGGKE